LGEQCDHAFVIRLIRVGVQPAMGVWTRRQDSQHQNRARQQQRAGSTQSSRLSASGDEEWEHDLVETILLIADSSSRAGRSAMPSLMKI
jgi:hypothetical protein